MTSKKKQYFFRENETQLLQIYLQILFAHSYFFHKICNMWLCKKVFFVDGIWESYLIQKKIAFDRILTAVILVCMENIFVKFNLFLFIVLTMKLKENKQHFQHMVLFNFKKSKNATQIPKID